MYTFKCTTLTLILYITTVIVHFDIINLHVLNIKDEIIKLKLLEGKDIKTKKSYSPKKLNK